MVAENEPAQPRAVIWIVDDLRSEVASLTRLLSSDFTLAIFENGPQMLERLKSAPPPDVLVLEQWLHGLTGVEICRELRGSPATVGLPILLLTVPVDDDEILDGLAAGADDYLIKPFSPPLLAARIVSLVRGKRLRERAERAEQEARNERDRFEALIEQSGDGVVAADEHGTVRVCNHEARRQRGLASDEAILLDGSPRFELLTLDGRPIPWEELPINRAVRGEKIDGGRWRVRRPDGSTRVLTGNASPLVHPDGSPAGAVLTTRDETERLHLEERLSDRARLLAVGTDVGVALVQRGSLRDALQSAAQALVDHLDVAFARIWTLDEASSVLELRASAGLYTHLDGAHGRVPVGKLKIGTIAATRRPHLTNAIDGDPQVPEQEWARREGLVAFAGYPLLVEDQLVGVLALFARQPLGEDTLQVLASTAQSIGLAVERDRAEEALRRSQGEQQRAEAERAALLVREKRARAEAVVERQKLHDLFMQAPVAIAIVEGPGRTFTLANAAFRALLGGRDVVGKPLLDALPDIAEMGFDVLLDRVMATGEPFVANEMEIKLAHHAEGEALFLNFVHTPKRDAEGRVDGVLISAVDVTEQVRARRAAETTSAEWNAMFNTMSDGVYLGDATGVRRANAPGLALLDVEKVEDLATVTISSRARLATRLASTGEPVPSDETNFARAMAGESFTEDYLIWHPTRQRDLRIRSLATPIRIGGVITSALILNTDITEQHHALEALQRSEESFRVLAEAIPQQVWTSTPDGALDFVNERVLTYFASTKEQVLGAGWQGVIHPEDLPACVERWTHALTTGDEYEVEFRLERADDTYRWHLGRAVPVRDTRGEIVKWFGTNTDIHEAKQIREELEERTRFEQHLLGIVSHDLRNPLGAILLGATALLETGESEWVTTIAKRIRSSAERSTRMISDLLDFTQARLGGGIRLTRSPVDLHALTTATIHEVEATYPDRTVALTRAGDTQGTWDADRLAQVVTNLVTNALKYSPAGTPVAVHTTDQDSSVELTVHNTGVPIPTERLGQIFEPLQRATDKIDMKTRSVGLGLYIVDAIVKAHGGTVGVVSTAESGTMFTVRLPRRSPG